MTNHTTQSPCDAEIQQHREESNAYKFGLSSLYRHFSTIRRAADALAESGALIQLSEPNQAHIRMIQHTLMRVDAITYALLEHVFGTEYADSRRHEEKRA